MWTNRLRLLATGALIFLSVFGLATLSHAQNATVNNNLVFGDVFPGVPKTITKYTAGAAAEYLITGTTGAEVTIDFALPTYMNAGGYNMQMIFTETDCSMDARNNPDQSSPQEDNLDPWHTITDRLGPSGLTVWLGGTVVPKLMQTDGAYNASIVITVAYTGN